MDKLCVFFVFALCANQALSMHLRTKRQFDSSDEDLEDKYGLNRPQKPIFPQPGQEQPPRQGQFPGQGQYPGKGQFPITNQFPGSEFPGQGQFPGRGQFPSQGQFPDQGQFPVQNPQQQSTTPAPSRYTTESAAVRQCIRSCPVTSEYNPVCGSNNQTYDNPGRLMCARDCGAGVTQHRTGTCLPPASN